MKNIGNRLKKLENKIIPKIQTVRYIFNKQAISERELNMMRNRGCAIEENDDYIYVEYNLGNARKK